MGEHNKKVNEIKVDNGMLALVLAIVFPGISTIIAGFMQKDEDCKKSAIIIGLIQWLTCSFLIGWIWSIMTGLAIKKNSA